MFVLTKLHIRGRLIAGFASMCGILIIAVCLTLWNVRSVEHNILEIEHVQLPTANTSMTIVTDIYASLAALSGWVLTANPAYKTERAALWQSIEQRRDIIDELSKDWANTKEVEAWGEFNTILGAFKTAQQAAEDIAHTPGQFPATRIFVEEASWMSQQMASSASMMIELESGMAGTPERKRILSTLSDLRSTLNVSMSNLLAYLLTGSEDSRLEFEDVWMANERRLTELQAQSSLLSEEQRMGLESYSQSRADFAPLPAKMIEIRESAGWDRSIEIMREEAAPKAALLLDILSGEVAEDGSRHGGIVDIQNNELLTNIYETGGAVTVLSTTMWLLLVAGFAISAVVIVFLSRSIITPIQGMTSVMEKLAHGDLKVEIPARGREDEIGHMAEAVQVFKENAIEREELALQTKAAEEQARSAELVAQKAKEEQLARDRRTEEEKAKEQEKLAQDAEQRAHRISELCAAFDQASTKVLQEVATAADQMQTSSVQMAATATETSTQARAVSSASADASSNVQTVAAATEELSSSISEISRQVTRSSTITQRAVNEAGHTNATMKGLAESSQSIGDVIELINDIASQTNLLALNATIEAARAGEAGKGFAVVASEVKSLAEQTSKATEEIAAQISRMQGTTTDAVSAISDIGETINEVNDIASSIAAAVEEQGAATSEISRNVQEASARTNEVSSSIETVTQGAHESSQVANTVRESAVRLVAQSDTLREEVDIFLKEVRAV